MTGSILIDYSYNPYLSVFLLLKKNGYGEKKIV